MPRFAANLSMLWQELDPYERFDAAAKAGFTHVEMLFPHELDADRLASTLNRLGLDMVVFDPAAGDWASGERGLVGVPPLIGFVAQAFTLTRALIVVVVCCALIALLAPMVRRSS